MKEPGLDNRHRDANGQISKKHSNAQVGTLRQTYGEHFAEGFRADKRLDSLLKDTNSASLSEYLKK